MRERAINEFIKAVTKGMSRRQRNEAKGELRAHILDSAEALAAERGVPVNDLIVREVIHRMGPPEEIAAMYPSVRKSEVSDKIYIISMTIIIAFTLIVISALVVSVIAMIIIKS